eukprot:symbB.v1.2.006610.t1/scaffold390.1/size254036/6
MAANRSARLAAEPVVVPASRVTEASHSGLAATLSQPSWISPGTGPASQSSRVASPRVLYRDVSPDRLVYPDSSAISPALRSWVECLVDNRVDQAVRQLQDGNFAILLEQTRRDANALSQNTSTAMQQSEEARRRLESHVRSLGEGQSRLMAIVENLSGETDRQHTSSSQAKAEALATVERVVSTVEELRRTMEQDGDVVTARLREHGLAIDELRRTVAEDFARLRATTADLQRQGAEATSRQRQNHDELASTAASVAASRQELAELARSVQNLDRKLAGWKSEVKVDILDEIAKNSTSDGDRLKLDALHREISQMAATRIDLEARIERLKVEMATMGKTKPEVESRLREMEQALGRRLKEMELISDNLRSEVHTATSARVENLEVRSQESQQSLARRFEALQVAVGEDVESTRLELKKLCSALVRLEDQHGSVREEISAEVRSARAALSDSRYDDGPLKETLRTEFVQKLNEVAGRLEQLEFELTSTRATRESFEYRVRDATTEAQQNVERLKIDLNALRTLVKQEQSAVAALDEQLWVTDQRLGQRIDEALTIMERERLASVAFAEAVRNPSSSGQVSPNRGLTEGRRAADTFAASVDGDASERSAGAKRVSGLSMAREAAVTLAAHGGLATNRLSDRRF